MLLATLLQPKSNGQTVQTGIRLCGQALSAVGAYVHSRKPSVPAFEAQEQGVFVFLVLVLRVGRKVRK